VRLQWRSTTFDERPIGLYVNLAHGGVMVPAPGAARQRCRHPSNVQLDQRPVEPARIVNLYAPAITATGSGLFIALINILPTCIFLFVRRWNPDACRRRDAVGGGGAVIPQPTAKRPASSSA